MLPRLDSDMDTSPPTSFAHFEVRRQEDGAPWELGRGAMGVTYKAYDPQLRLDVALKVINPAQVGNDKARALFLREARAAARVHHANVGSVAFLNPDPENMFYAMEFIAGESLRDWLHSRVPLRAAHGDWVVVADRARAGGDPSRRRDSSGLEADQFDGDPRGQAAGGGRSRGVADQDHRFWTGAEHGGGSFGDFGGGEHDGVSGDGVVRESGAMRGAAGPGRAIGSCIRWAA